MEESTWIGRRGEDAAVDYLRREGYLIVERNWKSGPYELDIIAERWDEIHFVEVKTRKAGSLTRPEQAIDAHKVQSLRRAATLYMKLKRIRLEPRFDVVAVEHYPNGALEVRFIPDALEAHW